MSRSPKENRQGSSWSVPPVGCRAGTLGAALICAGLLACGGDGGAGPNPTPGPATGIWSYFENIGNTALQVTCTDQGTLQITQSNASFRADVNQSGSCTGPGGIADNSGTASITGTISGSSITFAIAGCNYTGTLYGSPIDSAAGTTSCPVTVNNQPYQITGPWFAVKGLDFAPPTASGTVTYPVGDNLYVTNDTFTVAITASDDRKVLYAGYRLGPPVNLQDSALAGQQNFTGTLRVKIPANWAGTPALTIFARDALGRLTETPSGTITVLDAVRRTFQTVTLGAVATDMVPDSKRNRLYIAELEAAKIGVLDLGTFTLSTPITLPYPPALSRGLQMDLSPGGDTLVTPIASPALAFINLVTGAIDTVHITSDTGTTTFIGGAHVTSNGKTFAYGSWSTIGTAAYAVFEYDLATGTQARHTEIGIGGNLGALTDIGRSWDQTRMLVLDNAIGCGYVYQAISASFSSCKSLAIPAISTPTGTTMGDRWLAGNLLLDGSLNIVTSLAPSDLSHGAIAPDGSVAYYPTPYGYQKLQLPSGTVLERVRIPPPITVTRVTSLPDGTGLVLWSDPGATSDKVTTDRITLVDPR
ncbi:MAG TPA: hypothetical protein VLT17_04815 [Gemmatimonadales bacterium]|nr:hypothetical protein [Gemmatimonadales bacterium]